MRINIKHQTSNVLNIVFWCIFLAKPPVPQSPTKVNARHLQAALWVSTLPGLYKEAVFAWLSPVWPDASITGSQAEAAAWRVDCRSSFILLNEKLVTTKGYTLHSLRIGLWFSLSSSFFRLKSEKPETQLYIYNILQLNWEPTNQLTCFESRHKENLHESDNAHPEGTRTQFKIKQVS